MAREVNLRGRRTPWRRALGEGRPGPLLGAPVHLLALVLALGAIVYLFALGLEMHRDRPTRIVHVDRPPADEPAPETAAAERDSRYLLGGRFVLLDGVWVEPGLAGRAPDDRLALAVAGAAEVPGAAELIELGAPLRLRVGDEVVEIAFAPSGAKGD